MKTPRVWIALVATGVAASAFGQTVDIIILNRAADYRQTTAGAPAFENATPFRFAVLVEGSGLAGVLPYSFKKPGDAVTVYLSEASGVGDISAPTSGNAFASMAALDAAFGDGIYTVSIGGFSPATLGLADLLGTTNDGLPNAPQLIGTQDGNPVTWSGGTMWVDPTKELTLVTSAFTTNYSTGMGRVGMGVFGGLLSEDASNEDPLNPLNFIGNTAQLTFAPNTFLAGQTYSGDAEFNNIIAITDLSATYGGGAMGVSIYTAVTSFEIQAIPEPSTYALIFGGVALVGVMILRRRRAEMKS